MFADWYETFPGHCRYGDTGVPWHAPWWMTKEETTMAEPVIPHVHRAMCEVKLELAARGGITKDRAAPREIGGYAFRGIDDLDDVLCGLTAKHDLALYPVVLEEASETQVDAKGRTQRHVKIKLAIDIVSAKDGSQHQVRACGEGIDTGDKATGKAFSNARKIATFAAFMVPSHGENVEEYATQVAPAASSTGKTPAFASGDAGSSPAAATTEPKPGPKKAKPQPKPLAEPPAWAGSSPAGELPDPEAMMGRVGEVNTFPLLHAFAEEANGLLDGQPKAEVFGAIVARATALFANCRSAAEVKEGLALWKALGSPTELAQAGNAAYARFRQPPPNGPAT